jgi:hypothetical protein
MKRNLIVLLTVLILISVSIIPIGTARAQDLVPDLGAVDFNTFLGGDGEEFPNAIARDASGNIYITGPSDATWGSPIRSFGGFIDAYVAKLNSSGGLLWMTFLGGTEYDESYDIAVDSGGNVYVVGVSEGSWGTPLNPFNSGFDAFLVKLNSSGAIQWNTFTGGASEGDGVVLDAGGNPYISGYSNFSWGSPVSPIIGGVDAFAAKYNSSGALQWNTFLGGSGFDAAWNLTADSAGNIYLTGNSSATWGSPVNPYTGAADVFAAKLNPSGVRQWHTFFGGTGNDFGILITADAAGNTYVTGSSGSSWGSPLRGFGGIDDAFAVKLNSSGTRVWNTFLGGAGDDWGNSIALDGAGNLYVTGGSPVSWGTPINAFAGGEADGMLVQLNNNGVLQWHAFVGGEGFDAVSDSVLDANNDIYLAGGSTASWGSPLNAFTDIIDNFVAKISLAGVSIDVGGVNRGNSQIPVAASTRQSFAGLNSGPVEITGDQDILAAERVIYKVNGVNTSFTEMMGLPASQLDTTYWLPWYNNVNLDTQLRFANTTNSTATVHVSIGGVPMTGSPFTLLAGESMRQSFPGIDDGPVQIVSNQDIVAAERVIYKVNGVNTSFSEMMALPNSQLDTTYWLPWYNNVNLDTQLRFANVTNSTATVHVYIGGVEMDGSPFTLQAGESTRQSFVGIDDGPVQIVSDQDIVAAERVIYKINNVPTSFTEMMALPDSQLDSTYWLPWYNNVNLDTQLRFGNVHDTQTATVHVYIGGVEMDGSPFTLLPGESTRQSFVGIDDGPVQIVSNVNIVAAERVIYKVNNVNTSFSEMMALPNTLLDTAYWFPWYNNVDLDTQLRFGVP